MAALSQACPHWAHSHPGQTHPTLPLERSHISARRAGLSTRQWGSRGARHPPPPARIPRLFAYRLPDTRLLTHSEPGCGVSSATPSSPSSHTRSHIGDEPPGEVSGRHPGPSASRTGPTRHPPPGLGRQTWFTSAPCKCTWIPCAPTSYQSCIPHMGGVFLMSSERRICKLSFKNSEPRSSRWGKAGSVLSWAHRDAASIPGLTQRVKDLSSPPLQLGSDAWPRSSICYGVAKKEKKHSEHNYGRNQEVIKDAL